MSIWTDLTPSKRCDWIDQLRGWAVIIMIQTHTVNVYLPTALRPDWLNFLNGLPAPSFAMAAGFSLALSTFKADGSLRPFWPDTAKRLGFILLCAYALHAPGFTAADWTVLGTPQKYKEIFKIDVLQCIVFSLLILQVLARVIRNSRIYTVVALGLAIYIPLISPYLWASGVGDGLWMPIRGLLNGNSDRGLQALFPLFPWFAFPAFGAFLGGLYRWGRTESDEKGQARMSEVRWLAALLVVGAVLLTFGITYKKAWIWAGDWVQTAPGNWMLRTRFGDWTWPELARLHNTTLPSVMERMGWILMGGSALGFIEKIRPRWNGPNPVVAASHESLLLYMLHLNMIFGVMLTPFFVGITGWDWYTFGWTGTLVMSAALIAINLWACLWWQKVRQTPAFMRQLQFAAVGAMSVWFLVGGWWTFRHFVRSPELAKEPYFFLHAARARKGLKPTPDGLSRDPEEFIKESERRKLPLTEAEKAAVTRLIQARSQN